MPQFLIADFVLVVNSLCEKENSLLFSEVGGESFRCSFSHLIGSMVDSFEPAIGMIIFLSPSCIVFV